MTDTPMGLTPDEEAAWEQHMNTPPPQTADEVIDDMARSFGETLTEALHTAHELTDTPQEVISTDSAHDAS